MLQVIDGRICDPEGREVLLRGVNVDGMAKMPNDPHITTFDKSDIFMEGNTVSFVGRPFSLENAHIVFSHLKKWGFNTVRYIFTWEAIEHAGPGKYDMEFINYTIEVLKIAESFNLMVFMDPHQDTWGRFSGGSGAPMWTYYAAGLEPKNFKVTRAAIVQNELKDPEHLPRMVWPTNYFRHACQVMFTLFFGGLKYAPKAVIDGVNIQEYLQSHFMNACLALYKAIEEAGLMERTVFGVETLNEPNMGIIGCEDISKLSETQNLRMKSTPTALESMITATGHAQTVKYYEFGSLGPKAQGTCVIDPEGVSAWIQDDSMDKFYGFNRAETWELGRCIWAQHGVWDDKTLEVKLPLYFAHPEDFENGEVYAVETHFVQFWSHCFTAIRKTFGEKLFILCQPPTLAKPPKLKGTPLLDSRVIYSPHYYDGLTLMLKRWSSLWNVDALGYLRGHYKYPFLALKVGETNIRRAIKRQIGILASENEELLGGIPLLMSETGIPMDMNEKESYVSGDYTPQIKALDSIASGMESYNMHFTYWGCSVDNSNDIGDHWNREDFSFLSSGSPRAEAAYERPFPHRIDGKLVSSKFTLSKEKYKLQIVGSGKSISTVIYLPERMADENYVQVSDGKINIKDGLLYWTHGGGEQTLDLSLPSSTMCTIC